jgi:uncharacterized protein (DUF58 family)
VKGAGVTPDRVGQPLLSPAEVTRLLAEGARAPEQRLRRVAVDGCVGEHAGRRLGGGLDYAETRSYRSGDEPRHIHWRATARTGRLQVRRHHQDVTPVACLVVDRRAGMRFGTRVRLKVAQAARLALYLAARDVRRGTEVAALLVDEPDLWLPPAGGAKALHRLVRCLVQPCPPMDADSSARPLASTIGSLAGRLPPGSTITVISDLADLVSPDSATLALVGRRYDCRARVVYDVAELVVPSIGPLAVSWAGLERTLDWRDPPQRAAHERAFRDRQAELIALLVGAGWQVATLDAARDDLAAALSSDDGGERAAVPRH